jgi:hypothetical protein
MDMTKSYKGILPGYVRILPAQSPINGDIAGFRHLLQQKPPLPEGSDGFDGEATISDRRP